MSDLETAARVLMEIGFVADPESFDRAQKFLAEALLAERRKVLGACGAALKEVLEASELAARPEAVGFCADCLKRQFMSPGGLTCPEGHGGADTIDACDVCSQPVTAHASGCEAAGVLCGSCNQALSWSPSGHYCDNESCPEYHDTPAF